ncbi:MAG: biotin/lipoyl-binding protein, partial [Caldilineales bacterium]|nr:biotin/lipoyl-binding protein [Caldilineales bacterium]
MKRIPRILLAALLILGIGAGFLHYRDRASASTAPADEETTYTQIAQVQTGNLSSTLSVVGQLEAEQSSGLAFESIDGSTELLTLAVQAGNTVTQGQVLATIDPAPSQQALDQAESDLQAAEESLADLQAA